MRFFTKIKEKLLSFKNNGVVQSIWNKVKHLHKVGLELQKDYPPSVKRFLEQHGDTPITALKVFRQPIQSFINKALNIISMGKWDEARREYDDFFHLGLVINNNIKLEKNHTITIHHDTSYPKAEFLPVIVNQPLTIKSLITKAVDLVGSSIFVYDFTNNCQVFVMNILKANNLLTPELTKFIHQPVDNIVKQLPDYVPKVAKALTDTAAIADLVTQ